MRIMGSPPGFRPRDPACCVSARAVSVEPDAAEFEMLKDAFGQGFEAIMIAGLVPSGPGFLFFPEGHLDIEEDAVSRGRPGIFGLHGFGLTVVEQQGNI